MRTLSKIVFLFLFALTGCRNRPQIIFGETYFHQQKIQRPFVNGLDNVSSQTVDNIRGVYWMHLYAVQKHPALLSIDASSHLSFVLLKDVPDLVPGDFVEVSGVIVDTLLKIGGSACKAAPILKVARATVVSPTHRYLAAAQRDWRELRTRLEKRGRQQGSKLVWPQRPEWRLLVAEPENIVVVFFSAADLMYALDVNLVYDLHSEKLFKVYMNEWFKGE